MAAHRYVSLVADLIARMMRPRRRRRLPQHSTIDAAVELLRTSRRVLVLTGAGISTNCGIPVGSWRVALQREQIKKSCN